MDRRYSPPTSHYSDRVPCYCFTYENNGQSCACQMRMQTTRDPRNSVNDIDYDSHQYLNEKALRRLAIKETTHQEEDSSYKSSSGGAYHNVDDTPTAYDPTSYHEKTKLNNSNDKYYNGEYDSDNLFHKKYYRRLGNSHNNNTEEVQYDDCSNYPPSPNYQWIDERLSEEPPHYEDSDQESPLDLTMTKPQIETRDSGSSFSEHENYPVIPDEEDDRCSNEEDDGVNRRLEIPDYLQDDLEDYRSTWLKKIQTGNRSRVRSPRSWEFILRLLEDPRSNPSMIRWENETIGTFRLVRKSDIGRIWGMRNDKHKEKELSYDSFARNLRYHYKSKMLVPVSEKHLVYQFGELAMSLHEKRKQDLNYPFSVTT